MLRNGWQPHILCKLTGHADDAMINKIYSHLTKEDKINIVTEEQNRIEKKKTNTEANLIDEAKEVLAFLGASAIEYNHLTSLDDLHRLIYGKYELKFTETLKTDEIKRLFNSENKNLIERHKELIELYESAKRDKVND